MAFTAHRMRVYIQDADTGALLDISGDVRGFEVRQNYLDVTTFADATPQNIPDTLELDLHIIGRGEWSLDSIMEPDTGEWTCDFCGLPNKKESSYCGELHKHAKGCGAVRPKIKVRKG
jgi:hypothetical protein